MKCGNNETPAEREQRLLAFNHFFKSVEWSHIPFIESLKDLIPYPDAIAAAAAEISKGLLYWPLRPRLRVHAGDTCPTCGRERIEVVC